MKNTSLILFFISIFHILQSSAQTKTVAAQLHEDGSYSTTEYITPFGNEIKTRSTFSQLPNFPFITTAHPTFKNFRNVSMADLDSDGKNEIIVCLNETLFVIQYDGTILWSYPLIGTSNFPPSIADIDMDGDLEIALQTYKVPTNGNVYLFDHLGNLQNGWPLNIDNHFFLNGVTLADIDGNGFKEIIASERVSSTKGRIHALNMNGASFHSNWPVSIAGTPAFTPSVGDVNNDGMNELIGASTTAMYIFDPEGHLLPGFPFEELGAKYSYQSPLIANLDLDLNLEIIGARHNDLPGTYAINHEGDYYATWPHYDNIWTFATPAIADVDGDGDHEIFFGRPFYSENGEGEILLGYDHKGNNLPGFPISGPAGSEGVIAIADIDNNGDYELITGSKVTENGIGFIHAYNINSQEELENFPIEVEGFTYLNGAYLNDIDNDGLLDLTALSYQLKFEANNPDSVFINVFNLEVPYSPNTILFNGYKGSNDHSGNSVNIVSSSLDQFTQWKTLDVFPNPTSDFLGIKSNTVNVNGTYFIYSNDGQLVQKGEIKDNVVDISRLRNGLFILKIQNSEEIHFAKFIKATQ